MKLAPINLSNSGRMEALLRAGRLYLSLQDAVALALENNLDIELQRYGPRLAEADLLRAKAGGVVRGVPTGISQGPTSATSLSTGGGAGTGVAGAGGSSGGGRSSARTAPPSCSPERRYPPSTKSRLSTTVGVTGHRCSRIRC